MSKLKVKLSNLNLSETQPQVWARLIITILALANQLLAIFGKDQIEFVETDIYQMVSYVWTFIMMLVNHWKNASYTKAAQAGDNTMRSIEAQIAQGELEYEAKPNPECDHNHDEVTGRG